MSQNNRIKKQKTFIWIIVLALVTLALLVFFLLPTADKQPLIPSEGTPSKIPSQPIISTPLSQQLPDVQQDTSSTSEEPATTVPVEEEKDVSQCQELNNRIAELFVYLDDQDYLKQYQLPFPMQKFTADILGRLFKNPPVLIHENKDLFTITNNMAHLYRTMGAKNLLLLKDIFTRETGRIEHDFDMFYTQLTLAPTCKSILPLPFSGLYDYSVFFLSTLGGQSYLFRRPPQQQLLLRYYSVLILDQANSMVKNKYGLSIMDYIPQILSDMEDNSDLLYKNDYIATLHTLEKKYVSKP